MQELDCANLNIRVIQVCWGWAPHARGGARARTLGQQCRDAPGNARESNGCKTGHDIVQPLTIHAGLPGGHELRTRTALQSADGAAADAGQIRALRSAQGVHAACFCGSRWCGGAQVKLCVN